MRHLRLLGATLLAVTALGACAGGATTEPRRVLETAGLPRAIASEPPDATKPGVDPASTVETGQRLVVTIADEQYGLKNGGTVRLGMGVTAALYLDPYPPATLSSTLDVYLEEDGRAVDDGFVSVAYDMLAMAHGPFNATAKGIGGGHFLVPLNYTMFGSWEQTLTIRAGARRVELPLVVIAHP